MPITSQFWPTGISISGATGDSFAIGGNTPGINVTYQGNITHTGSGAAILVNVTTGIHTGSLVHVAAASLGLSSLLVSSATAFQAVKYAGAAYLIVLGMRRLLTREQAAAREPRRRSRGRLYRRPEHQQHRERGCEPPQRPKSRDAVKS